MEKLKFPPLRKNTDEKDFDTESFQSQVYNFFQKSFVTRDKTTFSLFPYQSLFADLFQVYPKFLLISEPGTGKTKTFIEACDISVDSKSIFIFEKNKVMVNNVLSEIYDTVVRPNKLSSEKGSSLTVKAIKQLIKSKYTVTTYTKFYNKYNALTDEELLRNFYSCIFVFDEIHKIIGNLEMNKEMNFFYRLFGKKILNGNQKIILSTATPITTEKSQIIPYIKLLGLKTDLSRDNIIDINFSTSYIKKLFMGYTFYVKIQDDPFVKKKFVSRKPAKNADLINNSTTNFFESDLYYTELKSIQLETYKIYNEVSKRGSYKSNLIQAAAFVFPDGSIGGKIENDSYGVGSDGGGGDNCDNEDEDSFFRDSFKVKKQGLEKYAESISKEYKIPGIYQLKNTFKKSENEDLGALSAKWNAILEIEKANENTPGVSFIYTANMKNGGGSIIGSLMLEKYGGYTNYMKTGVKSRKSYVIFNTEMSDSDKKKVFDVLNSKENATGNLIRIVIATSQLKEGVSFFNCVRVHLLNRVWTYTEDFQSISRALRTFSHNYLKEYLCKCGRDNKSVPHIDVNIYKHAVYFIDKKENVSHSVDLEIEKLNIDRQPDLDKIFKGLTEARVNKNFLEEKVSEEKIPLQEKVSDEEKISSPKKISTGEEEDKNENTFYEKDFFYKTLSRVKNKFSQTTTEKNCYIEKYYENILEKNRHSKTGSQDIEQYKNYITKLNKNYYLNSLLYKNSISIFGKYEQKFNNRIRLYRTLDLKQESSPQKTPHSSSPSGSRSSGSSTPRWQYFYFEYFNKIKYSGAIFKLLNNYFSSSKNEVFNSIGNSNSLIEDFYNKVKKNIFAIFYKETGELKIVDKTHKENNKGKNVFSFSKEELQKIYNKLSKVKSKTLERKETYNELLYDLFKKNKLLLIV